MVKIFVQGRILSSANGNKLIFCIGESPGICPFLKSNGDEVPKGPSPIIFQEWTDTRTFSDSKYIMYFDRQ